MQGHLSESECLARVSGFLGCWYVAAALINGGAAVYWWLRRRALDRHRPIAGGIA